MIAHAFDLKTSGFSICRLHYFILLYLSVCTVLPIEYVVFTNKHIQKFLKMSMSQTVKAQLHCKFYQNRVTPCF